MRTILIGLGTIGQSYCQLLENRKEDLLTNYGIDSKIVAVADSKGVAIDEKGINISDILSVKKNNKSVSDLSIGDKSKTSIDLIEEIDAELLVDATPTNIQDGEPSASLLESAMKTKKNIITANKGPLALAFSSIIEKAEYNNVILKYSATVGGGTPILEFGRKCLEADRILEMHAILNGTTNYILTEMDDRGLSFQDALKEAQELGYAEADPTLDVDGFDAAAKLVIMGNLLLGKELVLNDLKIEGIRDITQKDITKAKDNGNTIKLIASVNNMAKVEPVIISKDDPMSVSGALCSVKFVSEFAGEEIIIGKGAGGMETASAMIRDLVEIKQNMRV
ncbi:MAG: homoserine dehydrogenase [Thaumarchaeota archaeon]|nr:homoserine dehydrogenase [Nitrososphaerota archaeon]